MFTKTSKLLYFILYKPQKTTTVSKIDRKLFERHKGFKVI